MTADGQARTGAYASPYDGPRTSVVKVWHIPQIPGEAFQVECASIADGLRLTDILADCDAFQYEHKIKPDYANVSGVLVWSEAEGCYEDYDPDWHAADSGDSGASSEAGR